MKNRRLWSKEYLVAAFILAEVVLVLVSWILAAMMTEGVHSLLSSEGIRWLFGSFTSILASPLLVWLLLGLMAYGSLRQSGLLSVSRSYRDRMALRLAVAVIVVYVAVLLLLTMLPHAVLLSASGDLFPSAFSRSLVPVVAFGVMLTSGAYGVMSGRFRSLADIFDSLASGIRRGAWLLVLYVFLIQFCESLKFVFGS